MPPRRMVRRLPGGWCRIMMMGIAVLRETQKIGRKRNRRREGNYGLQFWRKEHITTGMNVGQRTLSIAKSIIEEAPKSPLQTTMKSEPRRGRQLLARLQM